MIDIFDRWPDIFVRCRSAREHRQKKKGASAPLPAITLSFFVIFHDLFQTLFFLWAPVRFAA